MITIKVSEITKIKQCETATIIYTKNEFWVCEPTQKLPNNKDIFIKLNLKGKSDK